MNFDIRESPHARSHDLELSNLREGDCFQNRDHSDAYTRLLDTAIDDASSDHRLPAESEEFLRGSPTTIGSTNSADAKVRARRTSFMRGIALLCACSLSIGSHYAAHFLGPLKSRLQRELGTSHTEFGLLLSAYGLNSTWTPLVGGILANKLGTTLMSILATSVILIGQILLLLGDIWENVRLMALGLFIFGLGSHGLGLSMALGLIAGKGASFLSARTSYPLTDHFGPRAPFYVSTFFAAFSVAVNLVYIGLSSKLVDGANAELEAADISHEARSRPIFNTVEGQALSKMAKSHKVQIHQITKLGDIFWSYIGLNVFCGMIWSPFIQLAANIIQTRYKMSEEDSANTASYLLSGSLVLYPLCGYIVDRHKHNSIVIQLLFLSSALTLLSYVWLALPASWTRTPLFSILTFALGVGFSPLLLVVIVPKIVPSQYVSTALGAHKSMEQTGSILVQTLSGILLDAQDRTRKASSFQHLINAFIFLNTLQAGSIWLLAYLQYKKQNRASRSLMSVASSHGEIYRLSNMSEDFETPLLTGENSRRPRTEMVDAKKAENRRGKVVALASLVLIVFAWVLFVGVAWKEFGQKS